MENVGRFTDAHIKGLKPNGERFDITEGNGFCLRVSAKGKKTWSYSYWLNGKSRRVTLGSYPSVGVAEARKIVSEYALLKERGIDPIVAKKASEELVEPQNTAIDVEWLANDFYNRYVLVNRKTPQQIDQQIKADIIPLLGKYEIDTITPRDITLALEKIVDRGAPIHANKVLRTIKQMFSYAISKGLISINPAQHIKTKNIGGVEVSRNRLLDDKEIQKVWKYFSSTVSRIPLTTRHGVKILLLTAVRTSSLLRARWEEVDFKNSLWTIPPEHLKLKKTEVHKPHKVHLSPLTKKLLKELKKHSTGEYIIPSAIPDRPANPKLFSHMLLVNREKLKIKDFNIHDFRATFSTHLAELGVAPHVVELALGHKLPTIMAVYNKHEYLPERAKALNLWANKITKLTAKL